MYPSAPLLIHKALSCSEHVEEESEGALFGRGRELERRFAHLAQRPSLQVVLPPGEELEVVFDPLVLEEKLLVAPQRQGDGARCDDAADQIASGT